MVKRNKYKRRRRNNESYSSTRAVTGTRARSVLLILGIAIAVLHQFRNLRQYHTLTRGSNSNLTDQPYESSSFFVDEVDLNHTDKSSEHFHYNNNVSSTRNHRSSSNTTNATQNKNNLRPDSTTVITKEEKFVRYDKVAIVTKIHGPHQWELVVQSMCLLHYAYNQKVGYDIIIFTAEPIPLEDVDALQQMLAPVNVSIVIDNKGLQEEIAGLAPARYENFMERCNVSSPTNLTWFSNCRGELYGRGSATRLAYAWQAEFRSIHIWHHPALKDYKYMVWLDTDGFCSKPWTKDPVAYFIDNDGIIMFDHFPQGRYRVVNSQSIILKAFNASACDLKLNKQRGHLERTLVHNDSDIASCRDNTIPNIHGFMHITNLDFYRSQKVRQGLKNLLGDCFLCRSPDDQLSVTIPAAIFEPERSWEMRSKGFKLDIFHNFHLDGMEKARPPGFIKYWNSVAKDRIPTTSGMHKCKITQRD